MTHREVQMALEAISSRKHETLRRDASLHGIDMKPQAEEVKKPDVNMSKKVDGDLEKALKKSLNKTISEKIQKAGIRRKRV